MPEVIATLQFTDGAWRSMYEEPNGRRHVFDDDGREVHAGGKRMGFGELIRDLRAQAGLTQEQLAKKAMISRQTLRALEQGQWIPNWASVVKLSYALGVPADTFAKCYEAERGAALKKKRGRIS